MTEKRIPRATRSLCYHYRAIAEAISDDEYLDWTENQFVSELMNNSYGSMSPTAAKFIYHELMEDAGLEPKTDD